MLVASLVVAWVDVRDAKWVVVLVVLKDDEMVDR